MARRRPVEGCSMVALHAMWISLLLWGGAAFAAEEAGSPPAPPESGAALPGALMFETKALPLTRQDAAYLALLNSRDVKIEKLNPDILANEIRRELSAFHPTFSLESSTSQSKTGNGSLLGGATTPEGESVNWSSGLKAKLISGAVASLDFTNSRTDSNNGFLTLNPQYSSNLVFNSRRRMPRNDP